MKIDYEVYQRAGAANSVPIVSFQGEPEAFPRERRKYTGKRAKIEAIKRFTGIVLDSDISSWEVDQYIKDHLFGTSNWKSYHHTFQTVANETEIVIDKFEFLYSLRVELADNSYLEPGDERLIYIINNQLVGKKIDEYKGLVNPILSMDIL